MSYAIGYIVYGINLTYRGEIREMAENKHHFGSAYSGNGDQPVWFGIAIGEIDEADTVDGDVLREQLTVRSELARQFSDKMETLWGDEEVSQELRNALAEISPKMMILWGSS